MKTLKTLQPQPLWRHFQSLCDIPHPSRHETAISEYVLTFARERGLECDRDDTGNVVVRKPLRKRSTARLYERLYNASASR